MFQLKSVYIPMQLSKPSRANTAKHVNEYIQYCNLVGDNGGVMMSEKQFDEYRQNYAQLAQNRVYTSWYNSNGMLCKTIGHSSKCFCDHPYKNHDYLQGVNGKVKCKYAGCKCLNYFYIPIYGSQDFKCSCKHSYQVHDVSKKNCKNCACKSFISTWSCSCGLKFGQHKTVSQQRKEKEEKGQVVNPKMGGVVSFSSILDGADRFQYGIKQQIKQKGIKVGIEQFVIPKQLSLQEECSAWQLYNRPLGWLK